MSISLGCFFFFFFNSQLQATHGTSVENLLTWMTLDLVTFVRYEIASDLLSLVFVLKESLWSSDYSEWDLLFGLDNTLIPAPGNSSSYLQHLCRVFPLSCWCKQHYTSKIWVIWWASKCLCACLFWPIWQFLLWDLCYINKDPTNCCFTAFCHDSMQVISGSECNYHCL